MTEFLTGGRKRTALAKTITNGVMGKRQTTIQMDREVGKRFSSKCIWEN